MNRRISMAFDGIVIAGLVHELNQTILNTKISKIAQPENDELLLTCKGSSGQFRVSISANASLPFLYLTDTNKTSPLQAPTFCMVLRKHIANGRIISITQPHMERIIHLKIEHLNEMGDICHKTLVIELMGKHSNIIFCDEDGTMIDSIKHVSSAVSSLREVLPGRPYFIPATQEDKFNAMTMDATQICDAIKAKPMSICKAIYTTFTGVSPLVASELAYRAGMDADQSLLACTDDEIHHLSNHIAWFFDEIRHNEFHPVIVRKDKRPIEFSAIELTMYQDYEMEHMESISQMLEVFYAERNIYNRIHQKSADLRKIVTTALERNQKKYQLQQKQQKDAEKREKYKLYGELINVYGYNTVLGMSDDELSLNIVKCWNEFVMLTEKQSVGLVMDPLAAEERKGRNIFSYFMPSSAKKFTVAFLYPKSPDTSDWIYAHDLGRNYLEETFPDQMKTICVNDVTEERTEQVLNDVIRQGADIIFEVAPQMMKDSLKVAVDHPDVKILNCSLNTSHKYIRTYYARMYEAKFLSGMIAGALAENDRIAYIADYPIYGMIANINAFALGASFTNPRARIYLAWSTSENYDRERFLKDNNIQVVSDQDMITPRDPGRQFGLYECSEDGRKLNLVMPLWNWGVFYEKMIQSILAGSYQSEENSEGRALNYWWGMSAGVIDLICSKNVPTGVKRLVDHLKSDIKKGDIVPFYGEIRAQDGTLKNKKDKAMKPEAIMEMDWLTDNVIGEIPTMGELRAEARPVVQIKGVEEKMK